MFWHFVDKKNIFLFIWKCSFNYLLGQSDEMGRCRVKTLVHMIPYLFNQISYAIGILAVLICTKDYTIEHSIFLQLKYQLNTIVQIAHFTKIKSSRTSIPSLFGFILSRMYIDIHSTCIILQFTWNCLLKLKIKRDRINVRSQINVSRLFWCAQAFFLHWYRVYGFIETFLLLCV